MHVAFDTSVLIAALVEAHPHHRRAFPWLEAVSQGRIEGECSAHALAECWSVLTRLPIDPPISPRMATAAIGRLENLLSIRQLPLELYQAAFDRCSEKNLRSGIVFDALHLLSAEASGVEGFLTLNARDFERLVAEGSPKIVIPPDPPSLPC